MINSRAKGARGERQWRDELRAQGYTDKRGQQFAGGQDSPDVICEELKGKGTNPDILIDIENVM